MYFNTPDYPACKVSGVSPKYTRFHLKATAGYKTLGKDKQDMCVNYGLLSPPKTPDVSRPRASSNLENSPCCFPFNNKTTMKMWFSYEQYKAVMSKLQK